MKTTLLIFLGSGSSMGELVDPAVSRICLVFFQSFYRGVLETHILDVPTGLTPLGSSLSICEIMISEKLTPSESKALLALAIFGAVIPNGTFLYYFLTSPEVTKEALSNPISLVFIGEAFVLMFVFAWVLRRWSLKGVSGTAFIVMSLLGSMVFSIPASLYLLFRSKKNQNH